MSKHRPRPQNCTTRSTSTTDELTGRVGLVYARVSSKRQEIEGTGLQSQEGRCKQFLANANIPYEKSFLDSYSGGGDFMKRPAMSQLIAYIDAHPYKRFVVVFDDLKRFARDTEFHLKLRTTLRRRDVVLRCLNFNFEDTPEGVFVETVLAASNELDRKQNQRQVIQKQQSRLLQGYRAFPAVKGYTRIRHPIHGKLDIPNDDAPHVREALEGFSDPRFVQKVDAVKFLQSKGVISSKQHHFKGIETFDKMLREVF